jgi:hypothetical protein
MSKAAGAKERAATSALVQYHCRQADDGGATVSAGTRQGKMLQRKPFAFSEHLTRERRHSSHVNLKFAT